MSSEETTNLVIREVFCHHGLLDNIINDHGSHFVSKFWRHLLSLLNISCKLSSSHHPQIDGQIKCTSQTLEQYLTYQRDDCTTCISPSLNTIIQCILHLRSCHSLHIMVIILDGLSWRFLQFVQIQVWKINYENDTSL